MMWEYNKLSRYNRETQARRGKCAQQAKDAANAQQESTSPVTAALMTAPKKELPKFSCLATFSPMVFS
eukprot:6241270-Ditylum_brightwellii.AAC.1